MLFFVVVTSVCRVKRVICKICGRFDLALLEAEFQKQKSTYHVAEDKQKIGLQIEHAVAQIPRACFCPHYFRKNKRKLTRGTFYSINLTILNSFGAKFMLKISILHKKRSTVI